ncbi:MAG: thioredoxin domain-containing protein [Polyangia bacterium]
MISSRSSLLCSLLLLPLFMGVTACSDKKADATPPPAAAPVVHQPLSGIDLSSLHDSDVKGFWMLVAKYPSACGKAHSLETSIRTDPSCKRSIFAARYIVRLLKAGLLPSEVEEHYEARFVDPKRIAFDTKNAPMRGAANAPVTLVEFSDFQCPHCKHLQPELDKVLEDYKGQVKLYFKNYPISRAHPDAALAAAAALAAGKQGKFWAFHDKLFGSDQLHEGMPVLEQYAKDLKLDMNKWKADIEPMKAQVEADHQEGEKANIDSTPTLFINGRKHDGPKSAEDIKDWIDEDLSK